jgi:hypothetical protein
VQLLPETKENDKLGGQETMKPKLTLQVLKTEAAAFAALESAHCEPALFGVTDGKAVGTYFEHKFQDYLRVRFDFQEGSSIFVEKERTADFQTTTGIRKILDNQGNKDDLLAFMQERILLMDEIEAGNIADELLTRPPEIGYLTISNALQWRLQYRRVIEQAGIVPGVMRLK